MKLTPGKRIVGKPFQENQLRKWPAAHGSFFIIVQEDSTPPTPPPPPDEGYILTEQNYTVLLDGADGAAIVEQST